MKLIIRARNCKSWFWKRIGFLIPPHLLINFEMQKYYENELRFNGVFSRNSLPQKIRDGIYVIKQYIICITQMHTHIGLLYFVTELILYILLIWMLNIFLKKLKNFPGIKIEKLTFFEYKQTIQECVDTFALDSLILCLFCLYLFCFFCLYVFYACFLPMTLKRMAI